MALRQRAPVSPAARLHAAARRVAPFALRAEWQRLARLPAPVYRAWSGHALGYHSRLRPAEVAQLLERAGFERIAVRRMSLPSRQYVEGDAVLEGRAGLPRRLLAAHHRDLDELDLRTAAAHYLYRKRPSR